MSNNDLKILHFFEDNSEKLTCLFFRKSYRIIKLKLTLLYII